MIKSITGFGSVDVNHESNQLTVIIRSINSRYLDIKFRGIDLDPQVELEIRKLVQSVLLRGNINIQISVNNGFKTNHKIKFDKEKFEAIAGIIGQIQKVYGKHLNLSELISINDLTIDPEIDVFENTMILDAVKRHWSNWMI